MKITPRELLCTLLCILAISAFSRAERNDVAIDPDGAIYSVSKEVNEVVVRHLAGDDWKIETRLTAAGQSGSPVITWVDGGLLVAWSEKTEDGGELVIAHINEEEKTATNRISLSFYPRDLALEEVDGTTAGILAAGEQALWLEVDSRNGKAKRTMEVPTQGKTRYPSILPGSSPWIAWEEYASGKLSVAAARIDSEEVKTFGRFRVRGYGSIAMPVLVSDGGVALVWQGSRDKKAALFSRAITEKGLGRIHRLHAPEGVGGIIYPRRAVGSKEVLAAATWNNVRWSAVRYDLGGKERQPRVSLRVDESRNMHEPVVAVAEEDTWLWSDGDGEVVKGTNLSERVFELPTVAPAADGELRYLAFGDSITKGKLWLPGSNEYADPDTTTGYTLFLQDLHGEILGTGVITQEGYSGENTIKGLTRLQGLLEVPGVYDRVLLLEGTNDWTLGDDSVTEVTIPNLMEMVALIRAYGATPIVGTMLPRDRHPQPYSDARAKQVTTAMIPVMQRLGVRIARFHELFPLDDEHLADEDGRRLHPTEIGYAKMAEIWMEALLTFEGDVNRDGKVNYLDAQLLSAALGTRVGNFLFNPDGDVNSDGIINIFDLSFVYGRFGTDFYAEDEAGAQ